MTPVFLTIVSSNYLAYARTLFASISEHYPASRKVLCIVDAPETALAEVGDVCTVLRLEELGLPNHDHFLYRYGVMELNTAVKPYALSWIARNVSEASNGIMYIDPDIQFFRRLSEVEVLIAGGALTVLTPHLTAPLYDDKLPSELSIMRAGVYNCGFIAVGPHARRDDFLRWWCTRLEYGAFVDFEAGLFTDQKWMDLAPGLFPDVQILRHPGYNVAYWNLAHRPLSITEDGAFLVDDAELAFFHFSGIDPHDPGLLSKHQTRFSESDLGPFQPAYRRYLQKLLENGYDRLSKVPYAFGVTSYGAPIVPEMRQVFRNRYDARRSQPAKSPFALEPAAFTLPAVQLPKAAPRIPELLFEAWKRRDLLRDSFDVYSRDGREALLAWYVSVGERVVGVSSEFVESARAELSAYARSRERLPAERPLASSMPALAGVRRAVAVAGLQAFDSSRKSARLRRLYYRIPENTRGSLHRSLLRMIGTLSLWSSGEDGAVVSDFRPDGVGINLIGYFRGEFSIGECARALGRAAMEHGPPATLINFHGGVADRCNDHSFDRLLASRPRYAVNLCVVNADQTSLLFHTMRQTLRGRYNIGFWFWELEKFPAEWSRALELVDEVWVSSAFVQNAVQAAAGVKPVRCIPYPVSAPLARPYARGEFGLEDAPFTFLFNFDYFSFVDRKNPGALISAFQRAFPTDPDVALVLKSIGQTRAPEAAAELRRLAGDDQRIVFLDSNLSRDSMVGLLSVADAYVSLHRSEGFGLGLAESMYLGKPVIATAYSGNMDFMDAENSFLVDYSLVNIPKGRYPHGNGQRWADPDLDSAARCMRQVREDAQLRKSRAARGQATVREHLSERMASASMLRELERIRAVLKRPSS